MFDDEVFSKSRLKSCFLFSFSSWASLMFDVDRGGNSCQWVVFVSCQYMNRVNIRQPKPDTNNKRVNIR